MAADQLTALMVFAVVASFTPGPNNTIATVTGANFGFRAVLPHVFGVPFGMSSMLIGGAAGVAALVLASPMLAAALKWTGVAYLLWLSWQLTRPSRGETPTGRGRFALPLGFVQSALFQYLNPKAWMFALATTTAFVAGEQPLRRAVIVVLVCALCTVASVLLWGWIGAALRRWLAQGHRLRVFNMLLGALLGATALWMGLAA